MKFLEAPDFLSKRRMGRKNSATNCLVFIDMEASWFAPERIRYAKDATNDFVFAGFYTELEFLLQFT